MSLQHPRDLWRKKDQGLNLLLEVCKVYITAFSHSFHNFLPSTYHTADRFRGLYMQCG